MSTELILGDAQGRNNPLRRLTTSEDFFTFKGNLLSKKSKKHTISHLKISESDLKSIQKALLEKDAGLYISKIIEPFSEDLKMWIADHYPTLGEDHQDLLTQRSIFGRSALCSK